MFRWLKYASGGVAASLAVTNAIYSTDSKKSITGSNVLTAVAQKKDKFDKYSSLRPLFGDTSEFDPWFIITVDTKDYTNGTFVNGDIYSVICEATEKQALYDDTKIKAITDNKAFANDLLRREIVEHKIIMAFITVIALVISTSIKIK